MVGGRTSVTRCVVKVILGFVLLNVLFRGSARSDTFRRTVDLKHNNVVEITECIEGSVTISMFSNHMLIIGLTMGNTSTNDSLIQWLDLSHTSSGEIMITLFNRTSTWGAQTNVIIWNKGNYDGWGMVIVPFRKAFAEDIDGDGLMEIVSYQLDGSRKAYRFDKGLFKEIN